MGIAAMKLLELALTWMHGLSAAAWFGAIVYRTFTVDPKAKSFLTSPADYERFSVHLAHNMRYVVSVGIFTCGLSGFALAGLKWNGTADAEALLLGLKVVVWLAALLLFLHVSYVHWPWRSLADPNDFPAYQRRAFVPACGMIALAGTGFLLGQACRFAPELSREFLAGRQS